jgi:hydroxymethylpyrimidine/phosphomethylpyrimidine kinase
MMRGRVLVIAGSDPTAGAGLQADLKTITALGGYGMTVVTAITVQDTTTVSQVIPLEAELVVRQAVACLDDIGADCIKIGMLAGAATVEAVVTLLEHYPGIPVVLDPVLRGTGGGTLLTADGVQQLRRRLLARTLLLTPNVPEAELLSGQTIVDRAGMEQAARTLATMVPYVLLKGSHLPVAATVTDVLCHGDTVTRFTAPRIDGPGFHGTGCTLAAAIAAGLAQGHTMSGSIETGRAFLREAMEHGFTYGRGQYLLHHGWYQNTSSRAALMPSQPR